YLRVCQDEERYVALYQRWNYLGRALRSGNAVRHAERANWKRRKKFGSQWRGGSRRRCEYAVHPGYCSCVPGSGNIIRTGKSCKRSEEHTSELQSRENLVCRLLLEKKNIQCVTTVRLSVNR